MNVIIKETAKWLKLVNQIVFKKKEENIQIEE